MCARYYERLYRGDFLFFDRCWDFTGTHDLDYSGCHKNRQSMISSKPREDISGKQRPFHFAIPVGPDTPAQVRWEDNGVAFSGEAVGNYTLFEEPGMDCIPIPCFNHLSHFPLSQERFMPAAILAARLSISVRMADKLPPNSP